MARIVSRVLVRLAIVAASLAWAGFVFTNTIGDVGRGERIARAVVDDGDARAEIVDPISTAVMSTTGLPADQRSLVELHVDTLLQDPATATAFVDPFAGSWARLLGEDDPRPAEFDLTPFLDPISERIAGSVPGFDPSTVDDVVTDADGDGVADPLVVSSVPLPRTQLDWMATLRSVIAASVIPLAGAAAVMFLAAFAIGDRRRVLRRYGIWAVLAGGGWVLIPFLAVWAARQWATGADSVIAVAVEEALTGLRVSAVVLLTSGAAAITASFAPIGVLVPRPAAGAPADARRPVRRRPGEPAHDGYRYDEPAAPSRTAPTARPAARPVGPDSYVPHQPEELETYEPTVRLAGPARRPTVVPDPSRPPVFVAGSAGPATSVEASHRRDGDTAEMPAVADTGRTAATADRRRAGPPTGSVAADTDAETDTDPLWDYYS